MAAKLCFITSTLQRPYHSVAIFRVPSRGALRIQPANQVPALPTGQVPGPDHCDGGTGGGQSLCSGLAAGVCR